MIAIRPLITTKIEDEADCGLFPSTGYEKKKNTISVDAAGKVHDWMVNGSGSYRRISCKSKKAGGSDFVD